MPIAWHPNRWRNIYVSEDEKKEIDPTFYEELQKCVGSIQYGSIRTFWDRKLYMNFLVWFCYKYTKIRICKCLKQLSTCSNSKYL